MARNVRRAAFLLVVMLLAPSTACAGQSGEPAVQAAFSVRPPVVLVHGIWDSAAAFNVMAARLARDGWQTFAVSMTPNDGSARLETLAEELRRFIQQRMGQQERFSLVGFSMGGLVARYYVQRLGGLDRLVHLVTVSTPNHGTNTAYLQGLAGVLEMRPGSEFLSDLNADADRLAAVSVTSIWSPQDLMIEPAASARLPSGKEVRIPFGWHSFMLRDSRVIGAVETALRGD
jgi:triacylglycerol lipase